jgi:predicted DNA binding CopG/RHH family protein
LDVPNGASLGVSTMKQPRLSDLKIDVKGTKAIRKAMTKAKKIKITVNVDEDLLMELRRMAESTGTPYQSLLNRVLKDAVMARKTEGTRLDRLEREIEQLKKKISA